jgi:hypothetical protein
MINPARKSASASLVGIKMLIIAASLAGTLFGWAILAAGQVKSAVTTPPTAIVQPSHAPNGSQVPPALRQVNGPFQPIGRTRSSR